MTEERTLIILKPDAMQRGLAGQIVSRFENRGFTIAGCKLMQISRALAEKHYAEHKGKGFYEGLVKFMTGSPVLVMVLEGPRVVKTVRDMMGATFCYKAAPGTIRGDLGASKGNNLIHGSDSPASAKREIELFFKADELVAWTPQRNDWCFGGEDKGAASEM